MVNHTTFKIMRNVGFVIVVLYPIYAVYWMYQDMGWGIFHLILSIDGLIAFPLFILGIMLLVFGGKGLKLSIQEKTFAE